MQDFLVSLNSFVNAFDLAVGLIVIIFVFRGYRKGLVNMVFGVMSTVAALIIAYRTYPLLSREMRNSVIYDRLKESIGASIAKALPSAADSQIVGIPQIMLNAVFANNNPEVYRVFNVSTYEEYIAAFVANMIINAISIFLIFLLSKLAIGLVRSALSFIAGLPLISIVNKFGGAVIGFAQATLIIWIALTVITLYFLKPQATEVSRGIYAALDASVFAKVFSETNIILKMVTNIFA